MIVKEEMYGVACDVCDEMYECNHTGLSFTVLESDIKEKAEEDGWILEEGKAICDKCMFYFLKKDLKRN